MGLIKLTDLGVIHTTERAIEEIAGYAATHCYGVVGMCEKSAGEFVQKIFGANSLRTGIKATVRNDEVTVDIHIKVSYGVNIKVLSENVADDISYAIKDMTNAKIKAVNVFVDDIVVNKE